MAFRRGKGRGGGAGSGWGGNGFDAMDSAGSPAGHASMAADNRQKAERKLGPAGTKGFVFVSVRMCVWVFGRECGCVDACTLACECYLFI